jgi:hypothetical protein
VQNENRSHARHQTPRYLGYGQYTRCATPVVCARARTLLSSAVRLLPGIMPADYLVLKKCAAEHQLSPWELERAAALLDKYYEKKARVQ